jgi:hypothetical protein
MRVLVSEPGAPPLAMIVSEQYASHCCIVKQEPDGAGRIVRLSEVPLLPAHGQGVSLKAGGRE